jgi:acetyltransferase-like isoleucine patch superfamily enzyme
MGIARIIQKLKLRYGSDETIRQTLRAMGVRVGERSRVYTTKLGSEPWLISIGEHCGISHDVVFVTHNSNWCFQDKYETLTSFGKIEVKDNVHIGVNAIILPNVTIGPDAVVGAGSVVTRDVEPGTVVAGNPARVICTMDELEHKALAAHVDIPLDREGARRVLTQHFWGEAR